jgi:hypothetical protein
LATLPASAEIIVSELMYNPDGTDLDPPIMREWIEIFNTGLSAVNIGGWQVGDSQDNQWASAFPTNTMLGPQQALVVTGDAATFDLQWGAGINRIQVSSFPTLANDPSPSNERAAIRRPIGGGSFNMVDEVNFDDANGWFKVTGTQGQSIFALPTGLSTSANDTGPNWAPSSAGLYGGRYSGTDGQNIASPGFVSTVSNVPFAPSPDAAWSMVVIPDSQHYVDSDEDKFVLTQMTEWIRDNREAYKIQLVLQEGDIVNKNNNESPPNELPSSQQWLNAQNSMFVLNEHVPYIMAAGNHDFGINNAEDRSTQFNMYFKATDNSLVDPAHGGILKGVMIPGELQNAYYSFTAPDGRKMLVLALEWEPRPATIAWANQVAALPEFADHTAVLLTHAYLLSNDQRYTSSHVPADYSGEELWQGLVKEHENFEMVFNGHFGGDGAGYLASTGDEGNVVHQMYLNAQFETYGGAGWMRIVEFLEDGETVRVRTYSPFLDLERTSSDHAIEFQVSPIPPPPAIPGDYNSDGVVNAADHVVWRKAVGTSWLIADGNNDDRISTHDWAIWRRRFGESNMGAGGENFALVPEPASFIMLFIGASVVLISARRPRPLAT